MTDSDTSPVEIFSIDSRSGKVRNSSKNSYNGLTPRSHHVINQVSSSSITPRIDLDSLVFLSSCQIIRDVTQMFDCNKKKYVESIGFGGLLHLPDISQHHKCFSFWLLRKLKWHISTLCVGEGMNLILSADHIGQILGLNHSGIDVLEKSFESAGEKLSFMQSKLAFLRTESDIVQAAQSFVQSQSPQSISQSYINNFKVAFVIFVMCRFLAPGENFMEGNCDFWGALEEPEAIICYNWSSYILSHILKSARILDWDVVRNKKISPISCCAFIIQVFYIDNIDFGVLNRDHNVFPRVKHYSNEIISRLIECDMIKEDESSATPSFGRIQMLRTLNSCYKFSPHLVANVTTAGFSPSPPVYSLPNIRVQKQQPKRSCDYTRPINMATPEMAIINAQLQTPLAKSLDIMEYCNGNLPSNVGGDFAEAFRSLQENLSVHFQNFTDGLKEAISKENTIFARRIVEHASRARDIGSASPLEGRRINYSSGSEQPDYSSGADSRHSKIPRRFRSPLLDCSRSSKSEETSPRIDFHGPTSSVHSTYADNAAKKNNQYARPCSSSIPMSKYGKPNHENKKTMYSPVVTKGRTNAQLDNKFMTPEPSVKGCCSEQIFSPTTETKIFNGISLSARQINSMQTIDLNSRSFAAEYSSSPIPKRKAQLGALSRSHWSLALESPPLHDPLLCANFFQWLAMADTAEELERVWIMHDSPRFIQVEGKQLRSEIVLNKPMSFSLFDIIIRRIKQLDRSIYFATCPLRWRHFFESDFSLHVLGDDHPTENTAVREQFTGPDVDYELCRCSIFFAPFLSNDMWCCYALDMSSKTIWIIDPSNATEKDDTLIRRHNGTMQLLKQSMSSTINTLFSGWNPVFTDFKPRVIRCNYTPCSRQQSGFFTIFMMVNFDGSSLVSEPSQLNMLRFRQLMLHEVLALNGNEGSPPSAYIHVLD